MALITKCPACTTMFKVVPDQLRVSDGWVRCGQCNEIFDANANLQKGSGLTSPYDAPVATEADSFMPEQVAQPTQPVAFVESSQTEGPGTAATDFEKSVVDATWSDPSPNQRIEPAGLPDYSGLQATDVATELMQESQTAGQSQIDDVASTPEVLESTAQPAEPLSTLGDYAPHSFMRRPRPRPSVWRGRAARSVMLVVCLLFTAALALQVMVFERDRLVAIEPATRGFLEPICAALGCQIAPLRQIESVVIDSSSFTKVRGDMYRLGFTLKNTAPIRIATPAMELTLTDLQDQAVLRRALLVADLGSHSVTILEPGAELQVNLSLQLKLSGQSEKIAGYRLLSFYP